MMSGVGGPGDVRGYQLYSLGPQKPIFNAAGQPISVQDIGGTDATALAEDVQDIAQGIVQHAAHHTGRRQVRARCSSAAGRGRPGRMPLRRTQIVEYGYR